MNRRKLSILFILFFKSLNSQVNTNLLSKIFDPTIQFAIISFLYILSILESMHDKKPKIYYKKFN